jgi:general secretion pathway protein M
MPKLNREQAISVAALALLFSLCVYVPGTLFQARSQALQEASERRETFSRLEAKMQTISNRPTAAAPPAAFLDASTEGLASAQLQSYLAHLAGTENASLLSSGGETAKRDDIPDTIRLQVTLELKLKALREVLYQLESGTPYVFVDALTIQPAGATVGRAVEDPLLRTTLVLHAFWRRGSS